MEGLELMQQMKKGNLEAYETWLEIHAKNITRFAFQYGCTIDESSKVAVQTFSSLFKKLEEITDETQLFYLMYQIAIEKLVDIELSETENLQFEEDQQLHNKIIKLEKNHKLVLVLSKFQGVSESEIAIIIGEPQVTIRQMITEAQEQLKVAQVEKQLSFLKKSYNRLKIQFETVDVLQAIETNEEVVIEKKPKLPRRTFIPLFAGGMILIALVIFSVVNSAEYKRNSAEKYIEQLKQTYEEELGNVYNELGFEEESFIELWGDMGSNYLGTQERLKFDWFIKRIERVAEDQGKINKNKVNAEFEELITDLETPATMAENLFENPLSDDLKASEDFLQKYLAKYFIINNFYQMKLYEDHGGSLIADIVHVEEIDNENIGQYPEEFQPILLAMEKQNIYLATELDESYMMSQFKKGEFSDQLRAILHEDLGGYITMLENSYYSSLPDEPLEHLLEMEKSLLATSNESEAYQILTSVYGSLLIGIIKGTEHQEVFGSDRKVKQEMRNEWKKIAMTEGNSPSAYIMQKIIAEMEENDWTVSEVYVFLDDSNIIDALFYAKRDNLASFQLTGRQDNHHISSWINPWPNQAFDHLVASTYEQFIENHDVEVLQESNPLTVFGLFYYANEKKDPETMWHLQSRSLVKEPLEAYVANWQPRTLSLKEIDYLMFDPYDEKINYTKEGKLFDNVKMVFEEGRWVIGSFGIKTSD